MPCVHGCGGLLEGDAVGDGDEAGGGATANSGVGAGDAAPGDAVAGLEVGDVGGYGDDDACGFLAEGVGEMGGVAAFAEVGVDEVDAGGFDTDEGFAGAGGWCGKVAEGEDIGGAGGEDLDGLHGCQGTTSSGVFGSTRMRGLKIGDDEADSMAVAGISVLRDADVTLDFLQCEVLSEHFLKT